MTGCQESTPIGNLISVLSGFPFPSAQFTEHAGKPLIRIRDLVGGSTETNFVGDFNPIFLVYHDNVLVGMDGDFNVVRWKGSEALLNQRVCKIISTRDELDGRFLYWWLKPNVGKIYHRTPQTTVRHLSVGDLLRIPAPTLSPKAQALVAAVLDTVDETIAKTEALIGKQRQMREGLLHDLLARGLDAQGHLRDPVAHPEQFQDSSLGRIPRDWKVKTLVSQISLPQGQVNPRISPYCDWTLVAPDHIESGTGRLIARHTARQQDAISGKYVFEPGDVLYSKIRPYLRKAALTNERGLCSADMYPLRPNAGVNPRFLLAAVLGESFSRFASAVSMRSGFPKINRIELAEFKMGWPGSNEQNDIAAVLRAFDAERSSTEQQLLKLNQLKSGLMTDLLTGRVQVPETCGALP